MKQLFLPLALLVFGLSKNQLKIGNIPTSLYNPSLPEIEPVTNGLITNE
jgi:hypothetical protein